MAVTLRDASAGAHDPWSRLCRDVGLPGPPRTRCTRQHKSGISAAQNGIHAHPITLDGATPEPSKTVVPCKRYRGFESPPLRLGKPRMACRDPIAETGCSRLWGAFGGRAVANSSPADEPRPTREHRMTTNPRQSVDGAHRVIGRLHRQMGQASVDRTRQPPVGPSEEMHQGRDEESS
jgi:hypothetical protein